MNNMRGAEDFLTKRAPKVDLLKAVNLSIERDARERSGHSRHEALRSPLPESNPDFLRYD